MEPELICNECGWVGDSTMLVSETEDINDPCVLCPDCGSNDIEDLD